MTLDFDKLLPKIGEFGLYQKLIYYLLCIPASLPAVFLTFNQMFLSATPDHWCLVPELVELNLKEHERRTLAVPMETRDGALVFSQCRMYDIQWSEVVKDYERTGQWPAVNESWATIKCQNGWEYDKTYYDRTLVTDFDLVCENNYWPSAATTAFYVGSLFGNVLFGWVADKWGRKLSFFLILAMEMVFAIACVFPPNYVTYAALRTLLGLTFPAIFQIPFIIGIELMGPRHRTFAGMAVCIFFASAMSLLAVVAYFCRDWFILAVVTSFPFLSLFGLWWIMPESPRWLLSKAKLVEAEMIIQKIAKMNKRPLSRDFLLKCQREDECSGKSEDATGSAWDLVRTPNMRKKTVIITFNWLSNAVVYNGLSYMCANLGVSDYLAFFISGLVEIPGYIIVWYAMERWGRRWSLILTQLFGGVACVCTMFVPEGHVWVTVTLSMIGKFGIASSFAVIYVFAGELYPTVVRAVGLAISSFVAGIGLIASPSLVYLAVYSRVLPLIIMGLLSVAGAVAIVVLPETLGCHLPQTIEEGEAFGKNVSWWPRSLSLRKRRKANEYPDILFRPAATQDMILENGPKRTVHADVEIEA